METKEMKKLHDLLTAVGIPHTLKVTKHPFGLQIRVYYDDECQNEFDDCVLNEASYGHEVGLLETYYLNECEGFETAEQVFDGWRELYKKGRK